jgi:crotonobetainyl-CoA:carnitine CoA-transferase CaiB-like acyl-CoA transferase
VTAIPDGPVPPEGAPGPLNELRVIELVSEWTCYAGKLLADLGAEVVLVEPPSGARARSYGPFLEDRTDREGSLWWWHYQTSKLGVSLDLEVSQDRSRLQGLLAEADIVLEGETSARLAALEVDASDPESIAPGLIWVSLTPFGRHDSRSDEPATDLTLLAGAGPVWSCGYDDHALPPVRGGGNQAIHTGGLHAVTATLAAVLNRQATGRGQHVDVSIHAALNVTTEEATFRWLGAGQTVQRQTGRHASIQPTMPTMATAADGHFVNTGAPPRSVSEFRAVLQWLDDLGLREEFPESFLLELGVERGGIDLAVVSEDVEAQAIYGAGREALVQIAGATSAYEYFVDGQRRGLATSVIYAPEEVLADPHFVARGFPTEVEYEALGRTVVHPGAPICFGASPWRIRRRAPRLGEHNDLVLGRRRDGGE